MRTLPLMSPASRAAQTAATVAPLGDRGGADTLLLEGRVSCCPEPGKGVFINMSPLTSSLPGVCHFVSGP